METTTETPTPEQMAEMNAHLNTDQTASTSEVPATPKETTEAPEPEAPKETKEELDRKLIEAQKVRLDKLMITPPNQLSKSEFLEVVAYKMGKLQHALATTVSEFARDLETNKEKVMSQHQLIRTLIGFQSDVETKIDALAEICQEKLGFTDGEYEERVDLKRELTRRADTDLIEAGDIVWIDYQSEVVGEDLGDFPGKTAENWAIKVGSGGFYAEEELIGQPCGPDTRISFEHKFEENYTNRVVAGKTLKFDVQVNKVKVHAAVLEARAAKETKDDSGK